MFQYKGPTENWSFEAEIRWNNTKLSYSVYYTVYSTLKCIIFFQISLDYFLYFLNYGELSSLGHSGECFIHDIQKSSTYVDNVIKDI